MGTSSERVVGERRRTVRAGGNHDVSSQNYGREYFSLTSSSSREIGILEHNRIAGDEAIFGIILEVMLPMN